MKRSWDQHHPATIHWLAAPGPPVDWILLTGTNQGVRPAVADRRLRVYRESKSDEPLQWLIFAPGLDEAAITPDCWNLPGLRLAVERAEGVTLHSLRWIEHARYGRCLEILFSVPANMSVGTEILSLRPEE